MQTLDQNDIEMIGHEQGDQKDWFEVCDYRLSKAMGGAEKVEIEHGNHSLSNRVHEAVQAIIGFVKREGPSGWDDPWS